MAKRSESAESAEEASGEGAAEGAQGTESGSGGATRPMLDLEFVKGLIEAVDGSGIDSLEITRAGTRVKIAKTPPSGGGAPMYYAAPPTAAPAPPASNPAAGAPAAGAVAGSSAGSGEATAEAEAEDTSGLIDVPSPMVGTFYRAPAPDAPPYVEVGSKVSEGQTLCILEAMKLMNELEAEASGVVREILVENAEPVEYGQVLFRIDPNG